jgi:hypothetical protein
MMAAAMFISSSQHEEDDDLRAHHGLDVLGFDLMYQQAL